MICDKRKLFLLSCVLLTNSIYSMELASEETTAGLKQRLELEQNEKSLSAETSELGKKGKASGLLQGLAGWIGFGVDSSAQDSDEFTISAPRGFRKVDTNQIFAAKQEPNNNDSSQAFTATSAQEIAPPSYEQLLEIIGTQKSTIRELQQKLAYAEGLVVQQKNVIEISEAEIVKLKHPSL